MKYRIEPSETGWVIVNARDQELGWSGGHWVARDMNGGAHLVTFADEAAADQYAQEVFGPAHKQEAAK
jgi:hypothetical protein